MTHCLEELKGRPLSWDLWAAATTQEEVTLGGAMTSAFQLRPTLAVAIDVTFAKGPGASEHNTFPLGEGVPLGSGPNIHPALFRAFKETAARVEIPTFDEHMARMSGTDAMGIQVVQAGIPTCVLGIPLRYMHTPVEMVALRDITRAGRLMAEFIAALQPDFLQKITWDD